MALTWNACGMEQCAEQDIIDLLEAEEVYWDVVLLQEGPTREEGSCTIIAGGHAFYVGKAGSSKRTTCVLLHRRWTIAKLSFYALNGQISYLDLEAGSLKLRLLISPMLISTRMYTRPC